MVFGDAYIILGDYEISYFKKTQRLVKCRNPWGRQEWKFQWSDDDDRNWESVSQADKERIGFRIDANDGQFFHTLR